MKSLYLSKEILKNNQLSPATKLVAHHLFHLSGWEQEDVIQSSRQIAKQLGIDHKTVSSSLNTLQDLGFLQINEDNTFNFLINGIIINKSELSNKQICNLVGDFVLVPTFSLYCDELTPAERDAYFKFFDFYFKVENKTFSLKKSEIHISSVATYYGDSERNLQKHIKKIKDKGYIDYNPINTNSGEGIRTKLIGVKAFTADKIWIINNGKSIKTREEVITTNDITKPEVVNDQAELNKGDTTEQSAESFYITQFKYYLRTYNSKLLRANRDLYDCVNESINELGIDKTIELLNSCNLANTVKKEQLSNEDREYRINEIITQSTYVDEYIAI